MGCHCGRIIGIVLGQGSVDMYVLCTKCVEKPRALL